MGASVQTQRVAAAREEFLLSGGRGRIAVRAAILTSWQRSRIAGVDTSAPSVPFYETIDPRGRLARAAAPVIERLQDQLSDIPVSIVLTDNQGCLIERKDSQRRLARRFDTVYFAPGFSYAEAYVGTNGVGTALEVGRPIYVCGPEHFNERSTAFACAGAPIRHPLTRRIEGLIDLSCLATDANPMMRAIVQQAALEVERLLLEHASARQRLVLEEFLASCRSSNGAVVAVSGDVIFANGHASSVLTAADEALLRLTAADSQSLRSGTLNEMSLTDERRARIYSYPVTRGGDVAGVVFEVNLLRNRPLPGSVVRPRVPVALPGLVGRSQAWLSACGQVQEAARDRTPLLITGENGVGKVALAKGAHQDREPTGRCIVIDCGRETQQLLGDLRAAGQAPVTTLVLSHVERLDPVAVEEAASLLDALLVQQPRPWVVGTVSVGSNVPDSLLWHFTTSVAVPPLRHRADDLDRLVPAVLKHLAPARHVECTMDAMRVLSRYAWPGNVAELQQALRAALTRRLAGPIRREDLPAECFTISRRTLTPIEALERDAIIGALTTANGNRKMAAANLGMSRSSLYRKIQSFGITHISTQA